MQQKPYACFGNIVHQNKFPNDEIWVHRWRGESFFLVKGDVSRMNTHSNEVLPLFTEGMVSYRDGKVNHDPAIEISLAPQLRPIVCTAIGDVEVYCLDPKLNKMDTTVTAIKMVQGEKRFFEIGTKMFICRGILSTGEKTAIGPTQLSFSSASKTVECLSEVMYAWIFP